ncbi:MAG: ubiquinol-cytochrome c reductase iron-sulfur subunit [Bdellovibrionales bacterium]|nr:ubiquinol-cytochrome c reductase iron-sulfur subunit [Bdellovibrionales bacterium]
MADKQEGLTRKEFINWFWIGWATFSVALGIMGTLLVRFLFPNVLFEKPSSFRAGKPDEYGPGVDERFKDTQNVWIVRSPEGFYALSTVCTHLGCTPNWLQSEKKFKCPCHGSGFRPTGMNFEGPAPRPLERYSIALDETGNLKIDKSKTIRSPDNWTDPAFLLKV